MSFYFVVLPKKLLLKFQFEIKNLLS